MSQTNYKKKINVYFWFDVEDYVTPESNDIPLKAVQILKRYKIPVTTKLVAEKIRFMKKLRRGDVISAIRGYCDIGYHTDTHSRHPLVYEYIANMNVLDGAREIEKRERAGLPELRRTFRKAPSCFGHAGSQWAPHYYPYLKKMGINVYMDATDIVNLDDSPYWYCGVLNLNNAKENYLRFDMIFVRQDGIKKLKKKFKRIYDRLMRHPGGGAISILWHPHTAINKVFWDALNFGGGKNPRAKRGYVRPKKYPLKITERALQDFEDFVKYGSTFRDVRFISAADAARIYRRRIELALTPKEISKIARAIVNFKGKIAFFKLGDEYISPAQAFCALVNFVAAYSRTRKVPKRTGMHEPLGPMSLPLKLSRSRTAKLPLSEILLSSEKVSMELERDGCIPPSIKIGRPIRIGPSDYLATLAPMVSAMTTGGEIPGDITLHAASMILGDKFVDEAAFRRACDWIILPNGFRAPKILEQAKLQAWTLVPAVANV